MKKLIAILVLMMGFYAPVAHADKAAILAALSDTSNGTYYDDIEALKGTESLADILTALVEHGVSGRLVAAIMIKAGFSESTVSDAVQVIYDNDRGRYNLMVSSGFFWGKNGMWSAFKNVKNNNAQVIVLEGTGGLGVGVDISDA